MLDMEFKMKNDKQDSMGMLTKSGGDFYSALLSYTVLLN